MSSKRIELTSGNSRAVFVHDGKGWLPDWIYEGDKPLLRFKDHEWLSLGRVVTVLHAQRRDGFTFSGTEKVLGCRVDWSVTVEPAFDGFFRVRTQIKPAQNIELVEALTTFETPYLFDGTERAETIIGGNPATVWHGRELQTPHYWRNPAWCYRRQEAAAYTYECHLPVLVNRIEDATNRICTSVLGNFNVCDYRDLFAQPTRTVFQDSPDYGDMKRGDKRGYKFIVGAVNWSSAYVKDPNILVTPKGCRQEVLVTASMSVPGGSLDEWLLRCWEVSYRIHGNDGRELPVSKVYRRVGASWRKAGVWLQKSLVHPGSTAMVHPENGPQDYVAGTRPLANWCYRGIWGIYRQVLPTLYYRADVLGQPAERAALEKLEAKLNLKPEKPAPPWDEPDATLGIKVSRLLAMEFNAAAMKEIAAGLTNAYWDFGYADRKRVHINGGQASMSKFFRGAELAAKAYRHTGDEQYAALYTRFMNMAIGWGYHTFNGDVAEDFDFRGLAHASVAGRDQLADVPPLENSAFLDALGWLDVVPEKYRRRAWLDCAWLSMQSALSQYPAARTTKRLFTPGYGCTVRPLREIATERFLQKLVPYMAYENPYDQTLIATYQSFQGQKVDLVWGGALVDAGHTVLCLVPRAARLDRAEVKNRLFLIYNPRETAQNVKPMITFPRRTIAMPLVRLGPREVRWLAYARD